MRRGRVLATIIVAGTLATACSSATPNGVSTSATVHRAGHATSSRDPHTAPSGTESPAPKQTAAQRHDDATKKIAALIAAQPKGAVSVAELNTRTGARFSAGETSGMWTASAYKLLVLTALVIRDGDDLSSGDMPSAEAAIENSDNAAGYDQYLDAGGTPGVQDALTKLGMTHTVPGRTDPTFTTTSGPDYLRLLKALTSPGVLSQSSRSQILDLMRDTESDQRWGVGVVADKGTNFANKNGWLSIDNTNGPGETDNGLWVVTSVGVVTVHGQQVLMAVFTQHQPDFETGVKLVQSLARAMIPAVSS
jgi:beta-lactamase class A